MAAASFSSICTPLGFSTMSSTVGLAAFGSLSLISPALSSTLSARPVLVALLGMAILSPGLKSLTLLYFLEYRLSGEMYESPITVNL